MCQATDKQIIEVLKMETIPALGCTEPVACALACARCKEELGGVPEHIEVFVSGNIYKNGMGVGIPGTGMTGLPIAAALGAVCGKTEYGLEVLKEVSACNNLAVAKSLLDKQAVVIHLKEDAPDKLYAEAICKKGNDTVKTVIVHGHTNIILVEKNGKAVYRKDFTPVAAEKSDRAELSIARIWEFIHRIDVAEIEFVLEGAEMNKAISAEGLKSEYGLQIGKTLKENIDKGLLENDFLNNALICATAASDARMDGCEKPVMTNSGSGNQGITVSVPVITYAKELKATDEQLYRALALSNLTAIHQRTPIGRLSAYCGAVNAGAAAGAGIAYLSGGDYEAVIHTVVNALAIVSGIICDGAKASCAGKIAFAVEAGILGYNMYMQGQQFYGGDGIVKKGIEDTLKSVGRLGKDGMKGTNEEIIKIMLE